MSDDTHEVYAIRYGHHERRSSENFIGGDPHDVPQPLDFFVWAIRGPHGTFVVDTGFDEAMAKKRQRSILNPVGAGLKALGIEPDSVEDVIVSHLHYDHTGNYDLFPRARYHLQDFEMAYATGRHMCHAYPRLPFEVEDVVAMVRKVFAGRVTFHDGASEIKPGISVHRIGGHSKGLQCIRVKTRRGSRSSRLPWTTSCPATTPRFWRAIRRPRPGSKAGWCASTPIRCSGVTARRDKAHPHAKTRGIRVVKFGRTTDKPVA